MDGVVALELAPGLPLDRDAGSLAGCIEQDGAILGIGGQLQFAHRLLVEGQVAEGKLPPKTGGKDVGTACRPLPAHLQVHGTIQAFRQTRDRPQPKAFARRFELHGAPRGKDGAAVKLRRAGAEIEGLDGQRPGGVAELRPALVQPLPVRHHLRQAQLGCGFGRTRRSGDLKNARHETTNRKLAAGFGQQLLHGQPAQREGARDRAGLIRHPVAERGSPLALKPGPSLVQHQLAGLDPVGRDDDIRLQPIEGLPLAGELCEKHVPRRPKTLVPAGDHAAELCRAAVEGDGEGDRWLKVLQIRRF